MSFSGFFFYFLFFFQPSGVFRGLNVLKNSWKFAHTLESAAIRTPQRLGTRAWHRGSTAPPGAQSENLMYSSHILARIHMKLGTHIDLIELNNFTLHVIGSAQQEVGYSGLFKKRMLWIDILLWRLPPRLPPTRWTWSQDIGDAKLQDIFDISTGLPVARAMNLWRKNERQEAPNNIHIHCLILIKLQGFVRCMMPSA